MSLALEQRLEALREQWAIAAHSLERIYGDNHPPARAIRNCIGDLYRAAHPDADDIGTIEGAVATAKVIIESGVLDRALGAPTTRTPRSSADDCAKP